MFYVLIHPNYHNSISLKKVKQNLIKQLKCYKFIIEKQNKENNVRFAGMLVMAGDC